jgi:hypothetical protein
MIKNIESYYQIYISAKKGRGGGGGGGGGGVRGRGFYSDCPQIDFAHFAGLSHERGIKACFICRTIVEFNSDKFNRTN